MQMYEPPRPAPRDPLRPRGPLAQRLFAAREVLDHYTPARDRPRQAAVVILLLGAALRTWDVAGQALWSDEDITLDRTRLALDALHGALPLEHGPAYFALMRGWTRLVGDGDLALRAPSLLAGVVAVALAWALAGRLAGADARPWAGVLAAASPFLVSYSQEARMYALLVALGLGALYAASRLPRDGPRAAMAAGGLAALAIHVHVFGALVAAVLVAWAAYDLATAAGAERAAARRAWGLAAGALAVGAVPAAPRAVALLAAAGTPALDRDWLTAGGAAGAGPLGAVLTLVAAFAGQTVVTATRPPSPAEITAALALGGAALRGLYVMRPRRDGVAGVHLEDWRTTRRLRRGGALLWAWALLGTATAASLAAAGLTLHPRYLVAAAPALAVAAGVGLADLTDPWRIPGWRRPDLRAWRLLLAVLVVVAGAAPLAGWYADPAARKRDVRALVAGVAATVHGRDSVLLLDGPSMGLAKRYLPAGSPLKLENLQSDTNRARDAAGFAARLAELAARRPQLWLASDGAAATTARTWLAAHTYAVATTGVQDVTLRRFYAPPAEAEDAAAKAAALGCWRADGALAPDAGDGDGDAATPGATGAAPDAGAGAVALCAEASWPAGARFAPGEVIPLRLTWRPGSAWGAAPAAVAEHRVSVRLVDAGGAVSAARDARPVDWTSPTTTWRSGAVFEDRHGLLVPPGAPPGRYALTVTLYDEATLRPFASSAGAPLAVVVDAHAPGEPGE